MATPILDHLDFAKVGQLLNCIVQPLASAPGTPNAGQIYYDTTLTTFRIYTGAVWISIPLAGVESALYDAQSALVAVTDNTPIVAVVGTEGTIGRTAAVNSGNIGPLTWTQVRTALGALNLFTAPTATISMGSQVVSNVATPVAATDAATKGYADSLFTGLDWKGSCRVASTANVTVAAPGTTIDGVTMAAADRVLLKNQTAGAENGIYTWTASGSPMVRATDADTSAEVTSGMVTGISEGTANADTCWFLTTNDPITLATTALVFALLPGAGAPPTGTTNRITVTSGVIDIAATYVGQASITTTGTIITGTWNGTSIAVLNGGTGATTAAAARTNLGAGTVNKFAATIGDGSTTAIVVTHALGTQDVALHAYDIASGLEVWCDKARTSTTTATFSFNTAPATNAIRVVCLG